MQSARGFEYGVRHIISPESGRLSDVLLGTLQLHSEEFEFLLRMGSIYLNHIRISENLEVTREDYIRVHTKPRRFLPKDDSWPERIVFQNEDFVVLNKPSGLPVNASVDNIVEHTQNYLEETLGTKLFGTHRLDVATSGLIVFAKNKVFQSEFNKLFIERDVVKIYEAEVRGSVQTLGLIRHFMEPSPRAPKTVSADPQEKWLECLLEIHSIEHLEGKSKLRIQLHTGRTHQIRAQLSALGFPIIGDKAYGGENLPSTYETIRLRAAELKFTNPLTQEFHHFYLE